MIGFLRPSFTRDLLNLWIAGGCIEAPLNRAANKVDATYDFANPVGMLDFLCHVRISPLLTQVHNCLTIGMSRAGTDSGGARLAHGRACRTAESVRVRVTTFDPLRILAVSTDCRPSA